MFVVCLDFEINHSHGNIACAMKHMLCYIELPAHNSHTLTCMHLTQLHDELYLFTLLIFVM